MSTISMPMNEIWCSRSQGKMSRWLMFSNWGARCWKPQEDSNSDEWALTCRSMSSGNSLTHIGPNSRKMCLKMLKEAWFIHDKDVDLTDSICTCKTPPKTGSFGLGEMILMRALHSSAPDRHRHVGHSPVPGVSVWNTGARCARKRIRVQKGFLPPLADSNDGLSTAMSSPMIGVWLWACPLKKKNVWKSIFCKNHCDETGAITRGEDTPTKKDVYSLKKTPELHVCHCRSPSNLLRTAERRKSRGWAAVLTTYLLFACM